MKKPKEAEGWLFFMNLDSLSLSHVLFHLDAVSLTRLMRTCSSVRLAVLHDRCWTRLCREDFALEEGASFEAYLEQTKQFGQYRKHGFARLRSALKGNEIL